MMMVIMLVILFGGAFAWYMITNGYCSDDGGISLDECAMVIGDPLTLNGKMVRFENEKDDPFYGLTIEEAYAKLRSVGGFGKPTKKYYPLNEEQSYLLEAWDKGKNMTDLYYEALRRKEKMERVPVRNITPLQTSKIKNLPNGITKLLASC